MASWPARGGRYGAALRDPPAAAAAAETRAREGQRTRVRARDAREWGEPDAREEGRACARRSRGAGCLSQDSEATAWSVEWELSEWPDAAEEEEGVT